MQGEGRVGGGETGSNMMLQSTVREAAEGCLAGGGMSGRRGRTVESRRTPIGHQSLVQCGLKVQSVGTKGGC